MNEHIQQAATQLLFNPLAPEFISDPYPHYARLRTTDPIHLTSLGNCVASRHAEVSFVLQDKRFGKNFVERDSDGYGPQIMQEPLFRIMRHMMSRLDPPDHTRLRSLMAKAMLARPFKELRPRIQQIVDETIDHVAPKGQMDLVEDFAWQLPITIICDMLGIPAWHRDSFKTGVRVSARHMDPVPMTRAEIDEANTRFVGAEHYFQQLFELRRRHPRDDLVTRLVQAEEDGNKLSNEELTANIMQLFAAGSETTVNLIGNAMLALHRHPDQLALLKANPALITNAVEEFLRYDSSMQLVGRVAREDIDDLGGKFIPKGTSVVCLLGSANRDPAAFPDRPESLDITRPNVRPMSFGGGIHFCLGAQLARFEADIAITTLLRRLPDLRLDNVEDPEWLPTLTMRGPAALPARW